MSRGVAYSYDYFILIDENYFILYDEYEQPIGEYDNESWREFLDHIRKLFRAYKTNQSKPYNIEAYYIGEADRFFIGIDNSGGMPALFVEPKEWEDRWGNLRPYRIHKEVEYVFNRLVKEYPGLFYYPTSTWTVERLISYIA